MVKERSDNGQGVNDYSDFIFDWLIDFSRGQGLTKLNSFQQLKGYHKGTSVKACIGDLIHDLNNQQNKL